MHSARRLSFPIGRRLFLAVLVVTFVISGAVTNASTITGRVSLIIDPDGPLYEDFPGPGLGIVGNAPVSIRYTLDADASDLNAATHRGRYALQDYVLTLPSGDTYTVSNFGNVDVGNDDPMLDDFVSVTTSGGLIQGFYDGLHLPSLVFQDAAATTVTDDSLSQLLDLVLVDGSYDFVFEGTAGPGSPNADIEFRADVVSWIHTFEGYRLSSPIEVPVGDGPQRLIAADANGDGALDLATANFFGQDVSLLLGNGDGTFAAPVSLGANALYSSVAIVDLDLDQIADVIAATAPAGNIAIQLGTGAGAFAAPNTVSTGNGPVSIALADLDADGDPDLVAASAGNSNISVMLGNGDGTFATPSFLPTGSSPTEVVLARIDANESYDLATANQGSNDVSVRLGNGDGTFQASVSYAAGSGATGVAAGDIDGDGSIDLVTANLLGNDVSVLLGNGDGTFAPAISIAAGTGTRGVAIGDINGDVVPDIVAANSTSDDLTVLLGTGDGQTFSSGGTIAVGDGPEAVIVADLDGSGLLDIAVSNDNGDSVSVILNASRVPVAFDWVEVGDPGNAADPS